MAGGLAYARPMNDRFEERLRPRRERLAAPQVAVLVNLGQVHSRYGAQSEKALADLFAAAEREGWTLVFDEADALLGPRTEVASAHDRYVGLNTNFLLDRIERHTGVVRTDLTGGDKALEGFSVRHFPPD